MQRFVDVFNYTGSDYPVFDFPEISFSMPSVGKLVLVEAQEVDWSDYLDNGIGNVLCAASKFFISFILILKFLNYLKTKYDRIFGGVSDD